MNLTLALLQLLPAQTPEGQLSGGMAACRRAKALGADIALFPEMWNCGYQIPQDKDALNALAVEPDGAFVSSFGRLAKELNMAIAITFLEKPKLQNSLILFDRHGSPVLHYAKVHTCDFGDERVLTPGDGFSVADLDTAKGTVKVGAMICYDREFPESARILMLQGAEVILTPNACPMEQNRLCQLRARAYENMLAVATCNYPAGKPDCNGRSTVFDGIAYSSDEPVSRDMQLLEAPEDEGIYLAEIDLTALREYRQTEVHGNAYRRPRKYGLLVSEQRQFPFLREDYRL